jgi:DNA gyrase subunit A
VAAKGEAVDIVALAAGDEVVGAAELVDGEEELVLFASTGPPALPGLARPAAGPLAGGMAGMKLPRPSDRRALGRRHGRHEARCGAVLVGFSAVDLKAPEGVLDVVDEPLVVTGGGLPPEGRTKGPGTVSSVKVTPLSEYPRKGRATGGVRCQRLLTGEALLVLGWAGRGPAWAAAASGDPVELPATYGRRDGSGTPVEKPPVAVGRPHR